MMSLIDWGWRVPLQWVERWWASRRQGPKEVLVACSGCRQVRRWARRWARRWMFSMKTARKHVICFPRKQSENMWPVCRAKRWQTYFVFSRDTYQEKYNVFTKKTVRIKINFFSLFPWKAMNETGFLFRMQTDGIILSSFFFVCLGNGLNVFQANMDFTCFLTLFSLKTATIPSSVGRGPPAGCCRYVAASARERCCPLRNFRYLEVF